MPTHTIMTAADGDKAVTFDETKVDEVQAAMDRFNDLVKNQRMWATAPGKDGAPGRHVTEFEPVDLVFSRQLQGG